MFVRHFMQQQVEVRQPGLVTLSYYAIPKFGGVETPRGVPFTETLKKFRYQWRASVDPSTKALGLTEVCLPARAGLRRSVLGSH